MAKERLTDTVEIVVMDNEWGVFPEMREYEVRGRRASVVTWHLFIDEPRTGREFARSACGDADFGSCLMPKRLRPDKPAKLCGGCLQSGRGGKNPQEFSEAVMMTLSEIGRQRGQVWRFTTRVE